MYSARIEVAHNILVGNQKVRIHDGNNNAISIHDNTATGQWSTPVGPDAHSDGVIFTGNLTDGKLTGTSGSDALYGTSNAETLRGTAGGDKIYGLGGADKLYGEAGSDIIDGGNGSDYLYGGLGGDVLTGSAGNDVFVFNVALTAGADRVTDFAHGYDSFRLENGVFKALTTTGQLSSSMFHAGSGAHDASDRIIYNPVSGALTYDADGTGALAPVQFAVLGIGLTVTASDFVVW